ncbi:MAG TPA: class I adenylate-forming enzyme family protein [Burkholderiaceae bacterium]|nr:class I adenylate-forming enzyme family protein [Burkholderiaceae bacterium]
MNTDVSSVDAHAHHEIAAIRATVENAGMPDTLGDAIRLAATAHADKVAGVWFDEGAELTYRQIDEQASRLACSLLAMGVRKGTHVAVMLGNLPAFPVTWVALARLGAVMIPVNTAYRLNDLHFVLTDSDAQFFIVADEYLKLFEQIEDRLELLTRRGVIIHGDAQDGFAYWQQLVDDGQPDFEPPFAVSRTDLLNIQYTSGTTGFPKGCMLSHDYWLLLTQVAAAPHINNNSMKNVLIWQPFFYMDGMWLFLLALQLGGTAHIAKRMRLNQFYNWLEHRDIHYCIFPEAALRSQHAGPQDARLSLQYASIYGWSHASREEFKKRFSAIAREGYGMTEIGLALLVPNGADERAMDKTCGLPVAHRAFRIVDENGHDVPDNMPGELMVSGRSILWGYYKRPEENARAFDGHWFRTGDVFQRDSAGFYYLVGRSKDMIKRSGENVAAREVEATLLENSHIAEAAVVGVPDPVRGEEVKAYILLKEGIAAEHCPPEAIIAHCQQLLAPFKVPRYITYVDAFPRTPSRKIQKPSLVKLDAEQQWPTHDARASR